MSTRIRNLSVEKTLADDADYFIGDDPNNGATYKITRKNLLTGILSSGGGGGLMTPTTVLSASYQVDFSDLKGHAVNVVGTPSISADKSPFVGGSSLYLPGSSYLQYTANPDFKINTDWAIELFAWIPSTYSSNNLYSTFFWLNSPIQLSVGGLRSGYSNNGTFNQSYAQVYGDNINTSAYSQSPAVFNTWNHHAAVKVGNTIYYLINGICQDAMLLPKQLVLKNNPSINIGYQDGVSPLSGAYIAGLRIQSLSFKVPTLPFT